MLAILAPGQGAQTPGLLTPWLALDDAAERLRWLATAAGTDLEAAGTTGTAEDIRDTAIAQPLIVVAGLLAADHLRLRADGVLVAGHSVGELTAAVLSGVLSPEAAMLLVAARGRAMAAAAAGAEESGMTAILGGDADEVVGHIERLGLVAANRNGAGQIVAAGAATALQALAADPPPRAKMRALQVAGAFHTDFMRPAREDLAALAPGLRPGDPRLPTLSNADGAVVSSGAELVRRLVEQVAAPVRWDLCQATMRELGVTAVLELPPAGTLAGLAKRELRGVEIVALRTPDDLPAAQDLLDRHAAATSNGSPPASGVEVSIAGTVTR